MNQITNQTTKEFIDSFENDESFYDSIIARLSLRFLPAGVDPKNILVQDILKKIKEKHPDWNY